MNNVDEIIECLSDASCEQCMWYGNPFKLKFDREDITRQLIKCRLNREMKAYECDLFRRENV